MDWLNQNMKTLTNLVCVPCRGGEPRISEDEIAELMPQIPDWHLIEVNDNKSLRRQFDFDNCA
jgi:4a-hydroxytetrahydrobiopterin dehydratase